MRSSLTRLLAPALLAATLALSACSSDEEATFEDAPAAPSQADQGAQQDSEDGVEPQDATKGSSAETQDVTQESAAAAGVNLSDVSDPVATVTVPATVDGDPAATMDVSLHSLTRDGQTVIGIFSFTVKSDQDAYTDNLYTYLGSESWTPHLIDTVNLTRHDVLSEEPVEAGTDSQGIPFNPSQTLFGYAAFAAPPKDITSVTVSLVDGAPVALEVPIQ